MGLPLATRLRAVRAREWTGVAAVLAAAVLVYLPSVDGRFVLDDFQQIRDPLVAGPLAHGLGAWMGAARPLVTATFALDFAAFGFEPRGWHLTNVAIHLAAVILVWRLARKLLDRAGFEGGEGVAIAVAGVFALHPLQTESVSYIVQRGEALASAFYVAGFLALLARDETETPAQRGWLLVGASTLHGLGLLAKPVAATLPLAWLLVAVLLPVPTEGAVPAWRRAVRRLPAAAPLVALSTLAAAVSLIQVAGSIHAGFDIPDVPVARYLATQFRVIPTYMRLIAWPQGQSADWYFPLSRSLFEPAPLAGALLLAGLVAGSIRLGRLAASGTGRMAAAARLAPFGVLFFLLALLPSSSVIPLADPIAERRIYLASFGLFLPAVAGLAALLEALAPSRSRLLGALLGVGVASALSTATVRRNEVWSSGLEVLRDAARRPPGKARVQYNLGIELLGVARDAEAVAAFRRALELERDPTVPETAILHNLVVTLVGMGRSEEALEETRRVLSRSPGEPVALALDGFVRMSVGDPGEGERQVRRALEAAPGNPEVLALVALLAYRGERDAEAVAAARAAIARDPNNRVALRCLGLASARVGDLATSREALQAAAALAPGDGVVLLQLGSVEAQLGDPERACQHLASALAASGSSFVTAVAASERARLRCR